MVNRQFWLYTLGGLALVTLVLGWGINRYFIDQRLLALEARLVLQNNLRREALSRYLETAEAELRFWSTNSTLVGYQHYLSLAWDEAIARGVDPEARLRQVYIDENPYPLGERRKFVDTPQDSAYRTMHSQLHPLSSKFVTERGYYDFFLVDPEGNISYTVEKEDDFGTNLLAGPYSESGLADVFRRAVAGEAEDVVVYSDFESYAPSNGAPAMFMANAMHNPDGTMIGVLAFQLPTHRIVHMMDEVGQGSRTGEAYIVGEDLLMRSESRFSEESTVLNTRVDTVPVRRALAAEYGVMVADDYRGVPVHSAYSSMMIDDHRWALLVEIDRAEVLELASGQNDWLAGVLLLLYGLGAWSIWYLRGSDADAASVFGDFDVGVDAGD
jgi:methyl-accepting chemotaxis protein